MEKNKELIPMMELVDRLETIKSLYEKGEPQHNEVKSLLTKEKQN